MENIKTRACLNPSCDNGVYARGLCIGCYTCARRLIAKKKTSWLELEKAKKALPVQGRGEGRIQKWLLAE